jgi:hypothetical protein
MSDAQQEEFIHFGMDLEFLLRRTPVWPNTPARGVRNILFKKGELTELAEKAEEAVPEE